MDIEQAYKEYFSVVYRYILSLSRDPLTAEEIAQQTFFKAMRSIGSFKGDCCVRVWLCQIAKNAYFDHLRKQSRIEELPDELDGATPSPEDGALRQADRKAILAVVHALKEPYKEVFTLRAYGELSFAEIAELFGKTTSWARVTYHRARMQIKEALDNG